MLVSLPLNPADAFLPSKDIIVLRVKTNVIFLYVSIQIIRSQNFGNFDQLIIIIMSMEERFFAENLVKVEYGFVQVAVIKIHAPSTQTYNQDSTCLNCNRIAGSRPVTRAP